MSDQKPTPNPYAIRDGETLTWWWERMVKEHGRLTIGEHGYTDFDGNPLTISQMSDRYSLADYFNITPPTFDTPETLAALVREWLRRRGIEGIEIVTNAQYGGFTQVWHEGKLMFDIGASAVITAIVRGLGWPLDLLNFLVTEVPWIRELHVKAGGK